MSYAAPFSLLSWHLPDHDESVAERLRWPLAGSALLHAVVFVAVLSLRFGSSLEQSSGSYEVTLVTLPEIAASPAAAPENESRRNAGKIPPPKAETGEAAKAAPQREAVSPPGPVLQEKPRVPERVTESLVGALDSVVVPKPQALALPQRAEPVLPPPLPPLPVSADPKPVPEQTTDKLPPLPQADEGEAPKPERVTESLMGALESVVVPKPQVPVGPQEVEPVPVPAPPPVKQSPALEMDVPPPIQAPPPPPKLAIGEPETPAPAPKVGPLADKLKQAVGSLVVPKQPEQASSRVPVTAKGKRKQDVNKKATTGTPRSSGITLPSPPPRPAAVAPPEAPKKETPLETAPESSTVASLRQMLQSVRIPEKKKPQPTPSKAVPLVPEPSPKRPKASEARNQPPTIAPPQAPQLTKVPVEQPPVALQPAVPEAASEPDTPLQEIDVSIPDLLTFDPQPVSKQTGSGAEKARGLWKAGLCSQNNPYWENVEARIDNIHGNIYRYHYRVESPAILTFRVKRNGQVADLDVVQSSGNKKFDSVAKRAVQEAAPLPPFPANMTKPFCQVQHEFKVRPN